MSRATSRAGAEEGVPAGPEERRAVQAEDVLPRHSTDRVPFRAPRREGDPRRYSYTCVPCPEFRKGREPAARTTRAHCMACSSAGGRTCFFTALVAAQRPCRRRPHASRTVRLARPEKSTAPRCRGPKGSCSTGRPGSAEHVPSNS
jgi:hypothetical protein